MRVCLVNDRFSTSAPGGFYRIQSIAQALRNLGHETVMVCPFFTVGGEAGFPEVGATGNRLELFLRNSVGLVRRLRGLDADVFVVEMPFPWTKVLVAIFKRLEGKRVFLDFGEFWLEAASRAHSIFATKTIEFALTRTSGASVTTHALQEWFVENLHMPSNRVSYVPCGVPSDFFEQVGPNRGDKSKGRAAGLVVGYSGTISRRQGCDRLLGIMQEVHEKRPDTRFLIVGDGPLLNELRADAGESGLRSSVTFTGSVAREDFARLVGQMDIGLYLKPYRAELTMGTFPQKVPEYMAAGCVPVSTPIQEVRRIIEPGVNGMIAEADRMADVIVSLIDHDALRERMSQAAAGAARDRYDWAKLVPGLVDFWEGTADPGAPGTP